MNGMASRNRYWQFEWQEAKPQPGELEYLSGATLRNCELRHSRNRQTRR